MSVRERNAFHPYIVNNNYYIGARSKMNRQALSKKFVAEQIEVIPVITRMLLVGASFLV